MRRYRKFFEPEIYPQFSDDYVYTFYEHLYDIDKDVDLIFKQLQINTYLEKLRSFKKTDIADIIGAIDIKIFTTIDSSILKCKDCMEAHKINPITINFGIFENSSYDEDDKTVNISLGKVALTQFKNYNYSWDKFTFRNNDKASEDLYNYFSAQKIKSSLKHELTHWLDDSLHNRFLQRKIDRAIIDNDYYKRIFQEPQNFLTDFEINGQVHALSYFMQKRKDWNKITFRQLIDLYLPLRQIVDTFIYYDARNEFYKWHKKIVKRMAREKILGNTMKDILLWKDLTNK